jgi:hypothetical protein
MTEPTEDVPYNVDEFATAEKEKVEDPDQPNKSVLKDILKYLNEQIKIHNSLDLIEPDAEKAVMTTQQQVVVQKQIVIHLRNVRLEISNKLKELK